MDENLKLVLQWFKRIDLETNINEEKLKRQLSMITTWFNNNCIGIIEAVTGFGKTMVAIIAIYRLNLRYPNANIIVIVPTNNLHQDWLDHILTFELKNVTVYVVNGYASKYIETRLRTKCALLIVDEVHNILSEEGKVFNQTLNATEFDMFMGLSATINEDEKDILEKLNIPIVDVVTMSEARRFNYVSDYVIYNIPVQLNEEERTEYSRYNDIHNSNFAKFRYFPEGNYNYELARACSVGKDKKAKVGDDWKTGAGWRNWYAEAMGWNGESKDDHPWHPDNINKYAQQWNWAMRERKDYLYKHPKKLQLAKEIIEKFQVPTITFGQLTESADQLTAMLGDQARSYHSNVASTIIKEEVVEERKNYQSAKLLRTRTQGTLDVKPLGNNKALYIVKYFKDVRVSAKRILNKIKDDFDKGLFKVLNTSMALNEGYNVEGLLMGIIYALTSKKRTLIQRIGRNIRYIEGKRAFIIIIYVEETQDESWVKMAQKGEANIRWIKTIDEII